MKDIVNRGIPCPRCGERHRHDVLETRLGQNSVKRRRVCYTCARPFWTAELDATRLTELAKRKNGNGNGHKNGHNGHKKSKERQMTAK